ncbi:hypothetical protein Fmac_023639 [Flemingia macrophylla]|uniref:Membrane-associated kinase regulator 5 n=1 Tax=Flemingia macrophylla TaxID=520843 RepID=A0ABD1LM33_9FABA
MEALNFLKFWRHATMTPTSEPHLVVETDTESDEDDSFFDLELTLPDFDNKENNITVQNDDTPKQTTTTTEPKDNDVIPKPALPLPPPEPISKRKILPIEPISKPQSPIALLRSAPSFRIFTFRKRHRMDQQKTEREQKNETKVFAVKLDVEDFRSSPALSRDNSTRSFGTKVRSCGHEEPKAERFSKEVLRKYLKLIKPFYLKVSKRYGEKVAFPTRVSRHRRRWCLSVRGRAPSIWGRVGRRRPRLPELVLRRAGAMIRCCSSMMGFKAPFFTARGPSTPERDRCIR